MATFTANLIQERMKYFNDIEYNWRNLRHTTFNQLSKAAVLVPLFIKDGEVFVWLTERSLYLRQAAGHVAFPGGKKETCDTDEVQTCLRESNEEIGLKEEDVEIICQVLPLITEDLLVVTPVVGIVSSDFQPSINKAEVQDVFYLPLSRFLSCRSHSSSLFINRGNRWLGHSFEDKFEGKTFVTWGLTAGVCLEVAICVYQRSPEFEWTLKPGYNDALDPFSFQRMYIKQMEETLQLKSADAKKMELFTSNLLKERMSKFNDTDYMWENLTNNNLGKLSKAAILVPVFVREGKLFVWLTERAHHLRNDGGHVAFPGGMKDECDQSEIDTCLRESHEEIGLKKEQVQVICQLLPRINRRLNLITPVVGIVDSTFTPEINKAEVEAAFYLPLDRFLSSQDHTSSPYENRGIKWLVHYFDDSFEGKKFTTWGLTALLCLQIAMVVYEQEPEFEWALEPDISPQNPFALEGVYLQRLEEKITSELMGAKL